MNPSGAQRRAAGITASTQGGLSARHRVQWLLDTSPRYRALHGWISRPRTSADVSGFEGSQLFEYHLYTLGRRTDLPDQSTKQRELFPAAVGLGCQRHLVFTGSPLPWRQWSSPISDQGFGAASEGTCQQ